MFFKFVFGHTARSAVPLQNIWAGEIGGRFSKESDLEGTGFRCCQTERPSAYVAARPSTGKQTGLKTPIGPFSSAIRLLTGDQPVAAE